MPHREIGGYFELEHFRGKHYRENALPVSCGRAALELFVNLRHVESIWVPDFICDCVPKLLIRLGVKVKTYRIGIDLLPVYDDLAIESADWMFLMDYYGQLTRMHVDEAFNACNGKLVIDETQGFFKGPWESADAIYTCRKFFGVPDGGYLITCKQASGDRDIEAEALHSSLPIDESRERVDYLLGRFEQSASEFFRASCDNNERFDRLQARKMSPITDNLMKAIDYDFAAKRRNENFYLVHQELGNSNKLNVSETKGPFMYPYLVDSAEGVRQQLAKMKIYIPTLWPNVLNETPADSIAYEYASNILPLPIDHRYCRKDMERMMEALKRCLD